MIKSYRNNWMEFCPKFGFRIEYDVAGYFDSRPMICFCFGWGAFYIHLPFDTGINECEPPAYGFYWYESALWIKWGKKVYAFHSPWSWDWYRTSYLLSDNSWVNEVNGKRNRVEFWKDEWQEKAWKAEYPYKYIRKNGEVQNRRAKLNIEEREWRRKFLMWTPLFNKVSRTIAVNFNDEVGEKTGSWKGGCTGCSYELKKIGKDKFEEPLTCLMRMEEERKF